MMFAGACLLYWRKKRKFDRLNEHGIEIFETYPEKAKADAFDTLLLWAGYVCLLSSIFMIVGISLTALGWLIISFFAVMLVINNRRQHK